jgi:hypothetical protein
VKLLQLVLLLIFFTLDARGADLVSVPLAQWQRDGMLAGLADSDSIDQIYVLGILADQRWYDRKVAEKVSVLVQRGYSVSGSPDPNGSTLRLCAIRALGAIHANEYEALLGQQLGDSDPLIRATAAAALAKLGAKKYVPLIHARLSEEKNAYIMSLFIAALGDLDATEYAAEIAQYLAINYLTHQALSGTMMVLSRRKNL